MKQFDFKMKEIRKNKSISQKELASKLNVSQQSISDWENGRTEPNLKKLVEIVKCLDVTLDELIVYKKIHDKVGQYYINIGKNKH
ncbi:MAG: helix-turn-helix transcriptional regulator [Acholeplasmataceae bacterium]